MRYATTTSTSTSRIHPNQIQFDSIAGDCDLCNTAFNLGLLNLSVCQVFIYTQKAQIILVFCTVTGRLWIWVFKVANLQLLQFCNSFLS